VAGDPVRWKERHVEGIAPLVLLRRLPRWPGVLLVFLATVASSGAILLRCLPPGVTPIDVWAMARRLDLPALAAVAADLSPSRDAFAGQGAVVLFLASLAVGIRCSGAITGERERQTWEALLLTPFSTRQLLNSKLWGILGAGLPYLLACAVPALLLAAVGGLGALLEAALWLGLTVPAVFYVGAAGLYCSARSRTSWRSLLGTLVYAYAGGFVLYLAGSVLLSAVAILLLLALFALQRALELAGGGPFFSPFTTTGGDLSLYLLVIGTCMAAFFLAAGFHLLRNAERHIATLERSCHWREDELHPRRRRLRLP
jgi:ABC-type transport system involved in multi-copper enzyme maturation permease subunit